MDQGPRRPQGSEFILSAVGMVLKRIASILALVIVILGLSWFMREFVFQAYEIPSGSMEDTIMVGDMVFAEKVSYYFREPEYKDIVTFHDPEIPGRILIKRCIATEGQVIDIDDNTGTLYVDGVAMDEPYTDGKPTYTLAGGVSFPYTVPEDHIWVMGDNRTNSQDSRYFGAVPVSSITGRGALVYWPLTSIRILE